MVEKSKEKPSNVDKAVKKLTNKPKRSGVNLYIDEKIYKEAQKVFGKKISSICEAALEDALELEKQQRADTKTDEE